MSAVFVVGPYRAHVKLGCQSWERVAPQPVDLTVTLRFKTEPRGCVTDELADTVCYAQLCDAMRAVCEAKEYKLIESLARDCLDAVGKLGLGAAIELSVHKLRPPVENLHGGSRFTLSRI